MRSPLVAFPDAVSARSGGPPDSPWYRIARRSVGVPARRPARGGGGRARGGRHGRPGVAADRRPVVLDAAGDRRPADLHEHPDALPRSAAAPSRTTTRPGCTGRGSGCRGRGGGARSCSTSAAPRACSSSTSTAASPARAPTPGWPAEFDVTPHLQAGENVLACVVVRWSAHSYLEDQDHWWMAGLHREVHLEARAPVHLGDVRVDAGLTDDLRRGTLRVRATVAFTRPELIEPGWTVEAQLESLDGRALGRPLTGAVPHVTAPYFFRGHVVDARDDDRRRPTVVGRAARSLRRPGHALGTRTARWSRWSARSSASGGSRCGTASCWSTGAPVTIQGVNRHDHHPERGSAVDRRRPAGRRGGHEARTTSTRVRCSHYPNDPRLLDLCDELGLYVVDEADIESHAYNELLCHDPALPGVVADPGRAHGRAGQEPPLRHPLVARQRVRATARTSRRWRPGSGAYDPSRPLHYEPGIADYPGQTEGWEERGRASPTSCARCTRGSVDIVA